jgi:hypothetical protein
MFTRAYKQYNKKTMFDEYEFLICFYYKENGYAAQYVKTANSKMDHVRTREVGTITC